MQNLVLAALINFNRILTAGIAIIGFSLLLYSLTFNLKDRVARAFAFILGCVTTVFAGDAVSSITSELQLLTFWLQLQWIGIIFLPFAYFYFSDALLATTGMPSRGRRRIVLRISLFISLVFLALLLTKNLVGNVVIAFDSAPYLRRTWITWAFTLYYGLMMVWSGVNFWRAYGRTTTNAGKRRMVYLMAGATAPAIGSFPFLLFGANVAASHHFLFWLAVVASNLLSAALIILMAYAVAFFGIDLPDRIVKSRLFRWILRGPVSAIIILSFTTFIRQIGKQYGFSTTVIEIVLVVGILLFMQYLITLSAPYLEKILFMRGDEETIKAIQMLEEQALTPHDLIQFLEAVLTAACDRLRSAQGFIAQIKNAHLETVVSIGQVSPFSTIPPPMMTDKSQHCDKLQPFPYEGYWLIPIFIEKQEFSINGEDGYFIDELPLEQITQKQFTLLGILGVSYAKHKKISSLYPSLPMLWKKDVTKMKKDISFQPNNEEKVRDESLAPELDESDRQALSFLGQRAAIAFNNQTMQQRLFLALEELSPQMEMIQRLRAAASYNGSQLFANPSSFTCAINAKVMKDALDHYWGGPKLTHSSLLELQIVKNTICEGEAPSNALRDVLRRSIESLRPSGDRRYTSEWLIYNLLSLKYLEGHKVRDIANRLAISEADFYRKQRTALDFLTQRITEMEQEQLQ